MPCRDSHPTIGVTLYITTGAWTQQVHGVKPREKLKKQRNLTSQQLWGRAQQAHGAKPREKPKKLKKPKLIATMG